MIVTGSDKPPLGGMGGSVHDWERGGDPFHSSQFPDEFKHVGKQGDQYQGWLALDWCGNIIGFLKDGDKYG